MIPKSGKLKYWKLALACVGLSLGWYTALAQQDGPPPPPPDQAQQSPGERGPSPERELKMLTRLLTLTTDQQTGVKTVLEQQRSQMQALRTQAQSSSTEQTPETRKARRAQAEQIREESDTKIAALLDDSQKKIFAGWEARRKQQMERRGRDNQDGNPPPPPPDGGGPPPNAE